MNSTDIQSKIQSAAVQFTDEIVAIFSEAFATVASGFVTKTPVARKAAAAKKVAKKRGRPAGAKKAAVAKPAKAAKPAKPAKPGKRVRRSGNQLVEVGGRVVKLLAANKKGLRIEQINKQLGTTTRQLARPIQKLLSTKKIRKAGQRRATVYFAG